jgi:site-specific DNA-cytosine methylase
MEAGLLDASPIWTDVKTFPWEEFSGRVDILSGGYPCQPFSAAGKRLGTDDPRHLWPFIANGIRILQPQFCFFENVEGHITLGLREVIGELESMGYKVSWGIFSAREVGAPHQRKRVFILAMANSTSDRFAGGLLNGETLKQTQGNTIKGSSSWPSRPNQPQYAFEPPRVVGNSSINGLSQYSEETRGQESCGEQGGVLQSEGASPQLGNSEEQGFGRLDARQEKNRRGENGRHLIGSSNPEQQEQWQAESTMGECFDESSSILDETLTLNPYGDNVYGYENLSKKRRAREILFDVWTSASSEAIQWTIGGLQHFLAEKILQSGMQLDGFTQRICYFVWCVQTGHKVQGWGLSGMSVYESCGSSSQGQKPLEQFKRELGYAMCQLSYEIALEGGQDFVEAKSIMHGVRESSERAWVLSQALPEMEEVWRSTLDQKVWEKGCYIEATSIGNRTDELRLLGNGVVPATATLAFQTLLAKLLYTQPNL